LRSSTRFGSTPAEQRRLDAALVVAIVLILLRPTLDGLRLATVAGLPVTDLMGGAIAGLVFVGVMTGGVSLPKTTTSRLLVWFVVMSIFYGVVVALWNPQPELIPMIARLLVMVSSYAAFAELARLRPQWVPSLIAVSLVPAILYGLYQWITGGGLAPDVYTPEADLSRVFGPFDHPNVLATAAAIVAAVAVSKLAPRGAAVKRGRWTLLLVASVVVTLPTFTRSVWICLPVVLLVVGTLAKRRAAVTIVTGAGVFLAIWFFGGQIQQRISGRSSVEYRTRLWKGLIANTDVWQWSFGHGLGQIGELVQHTTVQVGLLPVTQVHNDYLRVALETGLVGFLLYYGAIATTVVLAVRQLQSSTPHRALLLSTCGAFTVVLIVALADNIFELSVLQMLIWGLAGATNSVIYADRLASSGDASPEGPDSHVKRDPRVVHQISARETPRFLN
jgi:O-antigen ligase